MNNLKTTLLLATLTCLLILFGRMAGGQGGALLALIVAGFMNFISYWFSDRIVLAMYHAQPAGEADAPVLYRIVKRLAGKNNMPMPKVYIIPTDASNAFATGRSPSHASVAATAGIMSSLDENELEGVMAHELAHVLNRDTLTSTIAATLAGAITWISSLARWGSMFGGGGRDDDRGSMAGTLIMAIVAPLAALLLQMALSRSREYAADATGARMCGNPLALASALGRLESSAKSIPLPGGNPATSSLFIVNPFRGGLASLFSTHPPMEKRIEKLKELARRS